MGEAVMRGGPYDGRIIDDSASFPREGLSMPTKVYSWPQLHDDWTASGHIYTWRGGRDEEGRRVFEYETLKRGRAT